MAVAYTAGSVVVQAVVIYLRGYGLIRKCFNSRSGYRWSVVLDKKINMVHYIKLFILITLFSGITNSLKAEKNIKSDSAEASKVIVDFYNWYITSIKEGKSSEFQPQFVESKNGMTTLDFSKYFENLRKYKFSSGLMNQERESYQKCMDNLGKVKFHEFETVYTDLDHFEAAGCDFGNLYRWIGGQELIDGIRIKSFNLIHSKKIEFKIEYYQFNSSSNGYYYWGKNHIVLEKTDKTWKIISINWK
jgi:hypothetical protein